MNLVKPANKRKYSVIVVGSGLASASASTSLAELGYGVRCFCYQDRPRRAHSIAAQGGMNAAKNYQNDEDSVLRLFYDTFKGWDFRAREYNVHRLAEVSANIIDQCVPFAREHGGYLANRSFGGAFPTPGPCLFQFLFWGTVILGDCYFGGLLFWGLLFWGLLTLVLLC